MSNIIIDTSTAATDTIDYVATDQSGNTATSTRTVIIETLSPPPPLRPFSSVRYQFPNHRPIERSPTTPILQIRVLPRATNPLQIRVQYSREPLQII